MTGSEIFNIVALIVGPMIAIVGSAFAIIKIFFRYKSKILFITNCQILHRSIWEDMRNHYPKIKEKGPQDHAFRPLVLLPEYLKKYIKIKNGQQAILENINANSDHSLKIIAEIYWIPAKMEKWGKINHPVFSLILRRYFGIERPMYQDEKKEDLDQTKWELVKHSTAHLDKLHRIDKEDGSKMQWAMSSNYTHRYFNPDIGEKGTYESEPNENNFIEYCGFSIALRKRSLMHIEKE